MGSSRPENLATESRTICRPKKDRDMNQLTSCWTYSYDGNNNSQVLAYEDINLQIEEPNLMNIIREMMARWWRLGTWSDLISETISTRAL